MKASFGSEKQPHYSQQLKLDYFWALFQDMSSPLKFLNWFWKVWSVIASFLFTEITRGLKKCFKISRISIHVSTIITSQTKGTTEYH